MAQGLRAPTRAAWLGVWLLAATLVAGPLPFARAASLGDGCARPGACETAETPARHGAAPEAGGDHCPGTSTADACLPGCDDCDCCPSALLAILPALPPVGGAPALERVTPASPDPPDTGPSDPLERPPRA